MLGLGLLDFFDELAYGLGVLAGEGALTDLQARALVPTDEYGPDDPAFSVKARRENVSKD